MFLVVIVGQRDYFRYILRLVSKGKCQYQGKYQGMCKWRICLENNQIRLEKRDIGGDRIVFWGDFQSLGDVCLFYLFLDDVLIVLLVKVYFFKFYGFKNVIFIKL